MKFNQYYLDCLSHASYLIGDEITGRAVVVDPQRDVAEYIADAKELGLTIELVIETHFHADFLSGHLELAKATGAKIVYSSVAETEFESMGVDERSATRAEPPVVRGTGCRCGYSPIGGPQREEVFRPRGSAARSFVRRAR